MKPRRRLRVLFGRRNDRPANRRLPIVVTRIGWIAVGAVTGAIWWEEPVPAVATAVLAGVAHVLWSRMESPRDRARRLAQRDCLPFALDVAAAVLRAGAPVDTAVECAAEVATAEPATRLRATARALRLGAPETDACQWLRGIPEAERITASITRSLHSGAALAGGLETLASQIREERELAAHAAAHRRGVWMVLPLCLCFLPAFVIAGLLPVLLSAVDRMLSLG